MEAASVHDDRPGRSHCETNACNPQLEEGARVDYESEGAGRGLEALPLKCHAAPPRNHHGNPVVRPQPPAVAAGSRPQAVGENIQQERGKAAMLTARTVFS